MKKLYKVIKSVIVNDENIYNEVCLRYVTKGSLKEEETVFTDLDLFCAACISLSHSFALETTIFNNTYLTLYRLKVISKKKFDKGKIVTKIIQEDEVNYTYEVLSKSLPAKEFIDWEKNCSFGMALNG